MFLDPIERFWTHVDVREDSECWPWEGGNNGRGYGRFLFSKGQRVYAHRLAYEILVGPIPDGLQLDHLCRNPSCVNPAHLEPVTQRVNALRGDNHTNNANRLKTHCKQGHPFSEENTHMAPAGYRGCRTCRQEWSRAAYAKKKAAVRP